MIMQKESDRGSDDNGWHEEGGDEEVNDELEHLVDSVKKVSTISKDSEHSFVKYFLGTIDFQ